jgi:adenosine deaminase
MIIFDNFLNQDFLSEKINWFDLLEFLNEFYEINKKEKRKENCQRIGDKK